MKINKILTPIIFASSLSAACLPLTTLTSCSDNGFYNLLNEYTPKIAPLADTRFNSTKDVVNKYLDLVDENKQIFADDLLYTLSRGMPQYVAYISEFCEISKNEYSAKIDNIKVDKTKRQISCDVTAKINFDYGLTKKEELIWYDVTYKKWDSTSKVNFIFDFNTDEFTADDIHGQKAQMTSFAGATQLGLSELNSSVQLVSQTGSAVDYDNNTVSLNTTEAGRRCHFILPSEGYWAEKSEATYIEHYAETWDLWLNYWGAQSLVLILKYYMPSNIYSVSDKTPKSLDFGSYHLQNANLNDIYTVDGNTLIGFNISLDSIKNLQNLYRKDIETGYDVQHKILTLPDNGGDITQVAANAFDGGQSVYSNVGIPLEVEKVVVPAYDEIGSRAFAENSYIKEFDFQYDGVIQGKYSISPNAFSTLQSVDTLDFSSFDSTIDPSNKFKATTDTVKPFTNIHLGSAKIVGKAEGKLIYPKNADVEKWTNFAKKILGLEIYDKTATGSGWELVQGQ